MTFVVHGLFGERGSKYRIENMRVEPLITLMANDNWLEYTVRYVVPFTQRSTTRHRLFERMLDRGDASGGRGSLASATFDLVGAPPLEVRIAPAPPPERSP
ncbi:MAG: hypothetical protein IPG04_14370 [Polyangiaceae bacterium]|nr:hypothetical protein [Polyangiaceae bacterium]